MSMSGIDLSPFDYLMNINGETAQPGERIKGVFRNGYVNMGTWFKKDGNAVVVKDLKVY